MRRSLPWISGFLIQLASRLFIGFFVSLSFILLPLRADLSRMSIRESAFVGEEDLLPLSSKSSSFGRWVEDLAVANDGQGGFVFGRESRVRNVSR